MDEVILKESHKERIRNIWADEENRPSIIQIANEIFGKQLEVRSEECRAVKSYISEISLNNSGENKKTKKSEEAIPAIDVEIINDLMRSQLNSGMNSDRIDPIMNEEIPYVLSDDEKEFIKNGISFGAESIELSKVLFKDPMITKDDRRHKALVDFSSDVARRSPNSKNKQKYEKYSPPENEEECAKKVNKYIRNCYDVNNLSRLDKRNLYNLIGHLSTIRLVQTIDKFESEDDKILFESQFIRFTYDKPDLTQEEIDQYIVLCSEVVFAQGLLVKYNEIEKERKRIFDETNSIDTDLVDAASRIQTQYNDSSKRQKSWISDLTTSRVKKMERRLDETSSLLSLVQLMKEKESRDQIIEIGNERNRKIDEEMDKIRNSDDIIIRMHGMSKNRAKYG